MSCFNDRHNDLVLLCDGCGEKVLLYHNQTDKLLKHSYIKENGWKTVKLFEKWVDLCPKCKTAMQDAKREAFVSKVKEDGRWKD